MEKEELRTELKNFADTLINGYVEDTTIIEILGTNDCIDDYVDNELRERWENKPSEKEVLPLCGVVKVEPVFCMNCGKHKRLPGNGIMVQLCECGETTVVCETCNEPLNHGHCWNKDCKDNDYPF